MHVILKRTFENEKQTVGQLLVIQGNRVKFVCDTLELAYRDNKRGISCIPKGKYTVRKRVSPSQGPCFIIENTSPREWILIHKGNFYTDIRGCILAGRGFKDLNKDGFIDVKYSTKTIEKLLEILPNNFNIEIQ